MNLPEQGRQDMSTLEIVAVPRPVEVRRHYRNEIHPVLAPVSLAELDAHDLGDRKRKSKAGNDTGDAIDKALLAIATPRRVRDKDHLKFVAQQPCLVCGRQPSQAHHIRLAQLRAMSTKPSDEWVVPLCATHHRALHDAGDEESWWKDQNVDPFVEALQLWQATREGKVDARSSNGVAPP